MKADCWLKDKSAKLAEESEVSNLFMVHYGTNDVSSSIWLIESGCSNHMSGMRDLFIDLDESHKLKVRLGDNKEV